MASVAINCHRWELNGDQWLQHVKSRLGNTLFDICKIYSEPGCGQIGPYGIVGCHGTPGNP